MSTGGTGFNTGSGGEAAVEATCDRCRDTGGSTSIAASMTGISHLLKPVT